MLGARTLPAPSAVREARASARTTARLRTQSCLRRPYGRVGKCTWCYQPREKTEAVASARGNVDSMTECSANEQGTEQKGPSDLQRSTSDCRQSSSGMRRTPSTRSRKLSSSSLTPFGSAVALLEDAKDESMELSRPAPPPDPEKRKQLEEKLSLIHI